MGSPSERVWSYLAKRGETPSWWSELWSLGLGLEPLSKAQVWELARKHAAGFRLPAVQDASSGWWSAPHALVLSGGMTYCQKANSKETKTSRKWVRRRWWCWPKHYGVVLNDWGSPCITCGAVRDLWKCLGPLIPCMMGTSGRTPYLSLQGMNLWLSQPLQRRPNCLVRTWSLRACRHLPQLFPSSCERLSCSLITMGPQQTPRISSDHCGSGHPPWYLGHLPWRRWSPLLKLLEKPGWR